MKFSRFHRCTACILTVLFLMSALLLVGCGQSNQGNPSDTTASMPRETSPIVNATRVEKGMSYAEVHALLGFDAPPVLGEDFDAVTGATYSSRAVEAAIEAAFSAFEKITKGD